MGDCPENSAETQNVGVGMGIGIGIEVETPMTMIDNDCDCDPDPDSDTDHFHAHSRTAGAWVTAPKMAPVRAATVRERVAAHHPLAYARGSEHPSSPDIFMLSEPQNIE